MPLRLPASAKERLKSRAVPVRSLCLTMHRSALFTLLLTAPAAAAELEYYRDIFPFLKANCIVCHNKTTTKADLNMETPELMRQGGEAGTALIPGKGADSLVVIAARHLQDYEMPPANNKSGAVKLTDEEIALLERWIDQGAKATKREERVVAWQAPAPGVQPIYAVALTRDGRYAACGRGNRLFVYDLATQELAAELMDPALGAGGAHRALVQALAFSPDGAQLASGSFREVKLWRLEPAAATAAKAVAPADPDLVRKLAAAAKVTTVGQAALSPDGKQLASGCSDGAVRVWDRPTGKVALELRGTLATQRRSAELQWTREAQGLEETFQKTEVTRIEAQDKALDELLKKAREAITAMTKAVPEKQKAVPPATAKLEEAAKALAEAEAKLAAEPPAARADPARLKEIKDLEDKRLTAQTNADSARAAVEAAESNRRDAEEEVQRITRAKADNAKRLAAARGAAEAAKKAQNAAATDLAALAKPAPGPVPTASAFSPDGRRLATLFADGTLRVWATATGRLIEEASGETGLELQAADDGAFQAVRRLQTGGRPRWRLERTLGGEAAPELLVDRVNALAFSPDGRMLATGGGELSRGGDIHLFAPADGRLLQTWKDRHDDTVLSLAFSPDGRQLASGAADKMAKVSVVADGKILRVFEGHTHYVAGLGFRADGRVLASAGADGVVLVWDLLAGERKKKIEGWTKELTSLQFLGAGNRILTSAGDNRVRIVTDEGAEVRALAGLPDFQQAAAGSADGAWLVAGGEDSRLRVWSGSDGKELAVFEAASADKASARRP